MTNKTDETTPPRRTKCFPITPLILFGLLIGSLIVLVVVTLTIPNFGAFLSFQILNWCAFREPSSFIKGPFVQLIGNDRALVLWETCKSSPGVRLKWNYSSRNVDGVVLQLDSGRKTLFRTIIDEIIPLDTNYEIQPRQGMLGSVKRFRVEIPPLQSDLRIAVVGDNQMGYKEFTELLPKIAGLRPDVFLHVGDMVQTPYRDFDWQTYFFDPLQASGLMRRIPFIITQGNHDINDGNVAPYFANFDELPGRPSGYYYAITIGNVRLIVLDSNTEDKAQVSWLERELNSDASKVATFKIVSVHIPPYIEFWDPKTWRRGERRWPIYVRDNMVPLFEEYKVDLVISGHQHNYQRGQRNGVIYVTTGGGGGDLDRRRVENYNMYDVTIFDHHFTTLDIDKQRIKITMMLVDGQIRDNYTINAKNR
jgi:predicted phosphodiesterase